MFATIAAVALLASHTSKPKISELKVVCSPVETIRQQDIPTMGLPNLANLPQVVTPMNGDQPVSIRGIGDYPKVDMNRPSGQLSGASVLNGWVRGIDNTDGIRDIVSNTFSNGLLFQGQNMNAIDVLKPQDLGMNIPVNLTLGPGTVFLPDKPGYQDMVLFGTIRTTFSWSPDLRASIGALSIPQESLKGQTVCADMSLKEPAPGVRYFFFPPKDANIARIAGISAQARNHGPWDQARMWIYTDHASLTEVNKKLLPHVIPGYYTRCLRDLMDIKAMDKDLLKNKEVWSPELLFAPCGDEDAATKYFSHMVETFPKETRTALEKGFNDQVNALWTSAGADLKAEHLGFMMHNLLGCENSDVQVGMLAFLEKRVPAELRDHLKAMTGFDKVSELAESSNKAVADAAKKVMKVYGM